MDTPNAPRAAVAAELESQLGILNALIDEATAEDNRNFSEAEAEVFAATEKRIAELEDRLDAIDRAEAKAAKLADARAKTGTGSALDFSGGRAVKVGEEATIYNEGNTEFSYVHDMVLAFEQHDPKAMERINRHVAELNFASTTSTLDASTPPKYLTDDYLSAAASVRVVANIVPTSPWADGMTHYYPRVTGTVSVGAASENTSMSNADPTDDNVSTSVVFRGGWTDFSAQVLSQASVNWEREAFKQLGEQYGIAVEDYVLRDSTEGLFNLSGTGSVTYTDASPTVAELLSKVAQAKVQVSASRYFPANAIIMADRLWQWILSQSDTTGRPLADAYGQSVNAAAVGSLNPQGPAGSFAGLPVYVSALAIPLDGATPSTANEIIVCRTNEMRFREQGPRLEVDKNIKTQTTTFSVFGGLSFTAKRAPGEISIVSGTGLAGTF